MRETCRVEVRNRGRTVSVPRDEPLLDSLEAAGLTLPYGCRYGACRTCAARVIEGEVDRSRGTALRLEHKERGYALLCVARPLTDCVIEVGAEVQRELYVNPFSRKSPKKGEDR